jgi:hypothetical protein
MKTLDFQRRPPQTGSLRKRLGSRAVAPSVRTAEGRTTRTPDWLVETVAAYFSSLDADECVKFRAAVNARVTAIAAPQGG